MESLVSNVRKPTLILDARKARENIRKMAEKAASCGVRFRPHFKTHQSLEIGRWFREVGVRSITVSSLEMAAAFAGDGWSDITVAFPVNLREMETINELAAAIRLNVLVVHPETVEVLASRIQAPVGFFIKVDTGYHRTGISLEDHDRVRRMLRTASLSDRLHFRGFLTHAGHSYKARGTEQILSVHRESLEIMAELKAVFQSSVPELTLSVGDTPTCSVADSFPDVDEIRPGAFVFYDLMQYRIGSCSLDQVALVMACPVVAVHPERSEAVIYGGAVHFSKDTVDHTDGTPTYGWVTWFRADGWNVPTGCCTLASLSQEHGILRMCPDHLRNIRVGDLVGVVPVHCCLTANLMGEYRTLEGERIRRL